MFILSVFISFLFFVCLSLSVFLSFLSVLLPFYLHSVLSVYLPTHRSIYLPIYLSIFPVYLYLFPYILMYHLSICHLLLSLHLPVYLPSYLSLSVSLPDLAKVLRTSTVIVCKLFAVAFFSHALSAQAPSQLFFALRKLFQMFFDEGSTCFLVFNGLLSRG